MQLLLEGLNSGVLGAEGPSNPSPSLFYFGLLFWRGEIDFGEVKIDFLQELCHLPANKGQLKVVTDRGLTRDLVLIKPDIP